MSNAIDKDMRKRITIFSVPKPFIGEIGTLQRNAIRSWMNYPSVHIVLFGNEIGMEEFENEKNIIVHRDVKYSSNRIPLMSDVFKIIHELSVSDFYCYINCDIIIFPKLLDTLEVVHLKDFVLVGQRTNMDVKEDLNLSFNSNLVEFEVIAKKEGVLHPKTGMDYFIFPRHYRINLPEFQVGRIGWDSWLIFNLVKKGIPVVDCTKTILVIHQNHAPAYNKHDASSVMNLKVAGGLLEMGSIRNAQYYTKWENGMIVIRRNICSIFFNNSIVKNILYLRRIFVYHYGK